MRIQEGGQRVRPPPEKSEKYRVLNNTGSDPPKYHKATKPAFNDYHYRVYLSLYALDGRVKIKLLFGIYFFRIYIGEYPTVVFKLQNIKNGQFFFTFSIVKLKLGFK